jgi:hypothetical protein
MARLLTIGRDTLSKAEAVTVAAIEDQVPLLVDAREIIAAFHAMIRRKSDPNLDAWLDQARASLVTHQAIDQRVGRFTIVGQTTLRAYQWRW